MGISRLQMLNLETKIKTVLRSNGGICLIGWIRGAQPPQSGDEPEDFKGILFKPLRGGEVNPPFNKCKDVKELMELRREIGHGFILMPMFPQHFDNLEMIVKRDEGDQDND